MNGEGKISLWFLGIYEYRDGSKYDGEWKNNLRHGKGRSIK